MFEASHDQFRRPVPPTPADPGIRAPAGASPSEEPGRDVRIGWVIVALFFGLFLGWAAIARMDAAATASGTIAVSGNRQTVQSRDGGTVSRLLVREGQHVRAGEVLVELAPAEALALERSLSAQVIGLQAERARLIAEQTGAAGLAEPAEFAGLSPEDRAEADHALRLQRSELAARRAALHDQKRVLGQQSAELGERIGGIARQAETSRNQARLFGDELAGLEPLAAGGYVSRNRVRELQRQREAMAGEIASLDASAAATRQQIGQTRVQALGLDADRLQQVSADLRTVAGQLAETLPKLQSAREALERMRLRAPVTGEVVGLTLFTQGGVVTPGEKLMDIVPAAKPVVIEAKLAPNEAVEVHPGQRAEIKLAAVHDRTMPMLTGTVRRVSGDSFVDEKTGARYFTAEITVPRETIDKVAATRAGAQAVKSGFPVEILIPLRARTMLDYLVDPLRQSLWRSLHEQ